MTKSVPVDVHARHKGPDAAERPKERLHLVPGTGEVRVPVKGRHGAELGQLADHPGFHFDGTTGWVGLFSFFKLIQ